METKAETMLSSTAPPPTPVIKPLLGSTQLSMEFQLLTKTEMLKN